jgi:hypothetical protein
MENNNCHIVWLMMIPNKPPLQHKSSDSVTGFLTTPYSKSKQKYLTLTKHKLNRLIMSKIK